MKSTNSNNDRFDWLLLLDENDHAIQRWNYHNSIIQSMQDDWPKNHYVIETTWRQVFRVILKSNAKFRTLVKNREILTNLISKTIQLSLDSSQHSHSESNNKITNSNSIATIMIEYVIHVSIWNHYIFNHDDNKDKFQLKSEMFFQNLMKYSIIMSNAISRNYIIQPK